MVTRTILYQRQTSIKTFIGADILIYHTIQAIPLPGIAHDPLQLLFPNIIRTTAELDTPVQTIPEAACIIIAEQETIAGILVGTIISQFKILDLVMIAACIPIRGRRTMKISDLIDLTAGFVKRCPEDVAGRRKTKHRKGLVKPVIGYLSTRGPGNAAADLLVPSVIAHAIAHYGNMCVAMIHHKTVSNLFQQMNTLLGRV